MVPLVEWAGNVSFYGIVRAGIVRGARVFGVGEGFLEMLHEFGVVLNPRKT